MKIPTLHRERRMQSAASRTWLKVLGPLAATAAIALGLWLLPLWVLALLYLSLLLTGFFAAEIRDHLEERRARRRQQAPAAAAAEDPARLTNREGPGIISRTPSWRDQRTAQNHLHN